MVDKSRPIFAPRPSIWKRFINGLSWRTRVAACMVIAYVITHNSFFIDGYKNGRLQRKRERWIKDTAEDPDVGNYTTIDVEESPKPIVIDPNLARFREEFSKLRQKVDSDYRHNE